MGFFSLGPRPARRRRRPMGGRASSVWTCVLTAIFLLPCSPSMGARKRSASVRSPMQVVREGGNGTITLASGVRRAVHRYFPGFRVASSVDFEPDLVNNSEENHQTAGKPAPSVPFACVGDFDGNGLPDIALLLRDRRRRWYLVGLHLTTSGTFQP